MTEEDDYENEIEDLDQDPIPGLGDPPDCEYEDDPAVITAGDAGGGQ